MVGYFAFPPPDASTIPSPPRHALRDRDVNARPADTPKHSQDRAGKAEQKRRSDAQTHAQRTERLRLEREQVRQGEMEWVRAGGWLRDPSGRKDKARTEQLRAEVRLLDQERRAIECWDAYQAHWRVLVVSTTSVTFADIPWPVSPPPKSVEDLTSHAITEFFLAPLRVSTNTVSKKDRIRACILRWHPDKMSIVVARTVEQDLDAVCAGINGVFRVLRSLQDSQR